jgi:hypothetical protein
MEWEQSEPAFMLKLIKAFGRMYLVSVVERNDESGQHKKEIHHQPGILNKSEWQVSTNLVMMERDSHGCQPSKGFQC